MLLTIPSNYGVKLLGSPLYLLYVYSLPVQKTPWDSGDGMEWLYGAVQWCKTSGMKH